MANITATISDAAGFQPEVWAQRALDVLRSNMVLGRLVARDTDYDAQQIGATLNIPYPGTFTAGTKAADGSASVSTPSGGASVAVTLDSHKYVDFIVEDVARVQASSELLDRWVTPAAIALAEDVETSLFALYSGLTAGGGTSGTDLDAADIRTARKVLNDNKVPQAGRFGVVSSKDEIALLGDSALASYFANARPEAVAEGSMGRVYGFDMYMSQLVTVVAGTPDSTKNIFMTPDAMILATRPLGDVTAGADSSVIVDPDSGLAIRVLRQYDMNARGHRIGFDILYGCDVLRATNGAVILS